MLPKPKNENILQKLIREAFEAQVKKALDSTPPHFPNFNPINSLLRSPLKAGRTRLETPHGRAQPAPRQGLGLQERAGLSSEEDHLGKELK